MKKEVLFCILLLGSVLLLSAQTDTTDKIINPGFETGNDTGWTWTGTAGYAWCGVNTDGDNTKTGTYIAGTWNATIGDVELAQTITGLDTGMYTITADLMGSSNSTTSRLTTQRLFANGVSMLFGAEDAYSSENLAILGLSEAFTFGGYEETMSDRGPFLRLEVIAPVTDGSLTLGIRTNGKASAKGYSFPNLTNGDGHGWFKVDNFTLTYLGELTTAVKTNALLRNITIEGAEFSPLFNMDTMSYTVTLPVGTQSVTPNPIAAISGVDISGADAVDVSSGSGTSLIIVTSVDGTTTNTYSLNYIVEQPEVISGAQQDRLYTNEFPLKDVTLLEGPFKHAQDLNIHTLLEYDVDRLLAPYRKEAGLSAKATSYSNWIGLDGHIGGHYLSAMAINYAATGNKTCKELMDYIVDELKACQDANATNNPSWGVGYAGGVPNSKAIWSSFKDGSFGNFDNGWVPWYNLHKTYAGLRDAWLYGQNDTAREVFLAFCDWAIFITSKLSDNLMESMLNTEHGGMNEVLADAYQMTNDTKYLEAAKRFSHKQILNSMAAQSDNLDNLHANTQVPKAVGFERIAEASGDEEYQTAGQFFWETVVNNRTLAFGGNSRNEYFPPASAHMDYITTEQGPESCNTNNMLKLTEDLFRVSPEEKYAEYYERALFNHILSTQHPEHGGYVYFTPARPRHYRVYSAPNMAMWCCVGTGMENHGKYGEFIYTHTGDSLYLNLFIASELNWEEKGIRITQNTTFPDEEQTQITVSTDAPADFTLMVRSPKWIPEGQLKIIVNSDTLNVDAQPGSYIPVSRTWSSNDVVTILLPMHTSIEQLPYVPEYNAILHGPVVLGAKTGTEDLAGIIADDSRMGHVASGQKLPLNEAPVIIVDKDSISKALIPIAGEPMKFKAPELFPDSPDSALVFEPFYEIHDSRYMMYWLTIPADEYQHTMDSLAQVEAERLELEARTIDHVAVGEQQPETEHNMNSANSFSGKYQNYFWRDAKGDEGIKGFITYDLATQHLNNLILMVRYWGNESGNRAFNIFIDDELLSSENLVGKWNRDEFINVEYPIPNEMVKGKELITVKFEAIDVDNNAGRLFDVRLLKSDESTVDTEVYDLKTFHIRLHNNIISLSNLSAYTQVKMYDVAGKLTYLETAADGNLSIECRKPGIKILHVIANGKLYAGKVLVPYQQ